MPNLFCSTCGTKNSVGSLDAGVCLNCGEKIPRRADNGVDTSRPMAEPIAESAVSPDVAAEAEKQEAVVTGDVATVYDDPILSEPESKPDSAPEHEDNEEPEV